MRIDCDATQLEAALLQARALVAQLETTLSKFSETAEERAHPICPECGGDRVTELTPGPGERWRVHCPDCEATSVDVMEGVLDA